jgi:hypothetical protein
MKRELGPNWTKKQEKAGKRSGKAWEELFAKGEQQGGRGQQPDLASEAKAAEVQQRHEAELLRYPNVVGVATGVRTRSGKPTRESCLVVYVERKLPRKRLAAKDLLPSAIEGIPIDVVETGPLTPLPA